MKGKHVSSETIRRLAVYLRYLELLYEKGVRIISSSDITNALNIPSTQFRKDLSFFGEFGKRGVGYDIGKLIKVIRGIIGIDKKVKIIIIGAGKLGSALIEYPGFSDMNIEIVGAFDNNPEKIGKKIANILIRDISEIEEFIKSEKIEIALICVPKEHAQNVCNILIKAGIKGILNFAPVKLITTGCVFVSNFDMSSEICNLMYSFKKCSQG